LHDAMKRLCAKGAKYYAKLAWFFRGEEGGRVIGRWGGVAGWLGPGNDSEWLQALLGSRSILRLIVSDPWLWERPVCPPTIQNGILPFWEVHELWESKCQRAKALIDRRSPCILLLWL